MELRAKKSLGQHFLTSRRALQQIISAANIKSGEKVLEIGPGTGILTEALLKSDAIVVAVEKDDRILGPLKEKFQKEISQGRLTLFHGDILDASLVGFSDSSFAIVANIPYYITGAVLRKFLEGEPRPNRMILLVQKEVAERIVAKNGKESVLSISVKAFGTPRIEAKVPRGAFSPPPSVDSAIISISEISDERFVAKNVDAGRFFEIVRAGFGQKRKYLKRNLESVIKAGAIDQIWPKLGLDHKVRAEDIKLEQWLEICSEVAMAQ